MECIVSVYVFSAWNEYHPKYIVKYIRTVSVCAAKAAASAIIIIIAFNGFWPSACGASGCLSFLFPLLSPSNLLRTCTFPPFLVVAFWWRCRSHNNFNICTYLYHSHIRSSSFLVKYSLYTWVECSDTGIQVVESTSIPIMCSQFTCFTSMPMMMIMWCAHRKWTIYCRVQTEKWNIFDDN